MTGVAWSSGWIGTASQKIIAEERLERDGVVYLRWREPGKWKVKSTKLRVRLADGSIGKRMVKAIHELASQQLNQIRSGSATVSKPPITISEGLVLAIDPQSGLYPTDSPHRREVRRELQRAAAILHNRTWDSLKPGDIRALYRARVKQLQHAGHVGHRGAEITVQRVLAVAAWLRGEEHIIASACHPPARWQQALAKELNPPAPHRPRHTREDALAIFKVSNQVDPRFHLLLSLGAEMRLGQVARLRRSECDVDNGRICIPGRGNKKGEVVVLTAGQLSELRSAMTTGYLAEVEARCDDYPLFPSGLLNGGYKVRSKNCMRTEQVASSPIGASAVRNWFKQAERLAGVPHQPGRGAYGIRRLMVDEAKRAGISREGLQVAGGWTTTQVPDMIYADQKSMYAREEAARIRAQIRGETFPQVTDKNLKNDVKSPTGDAPDVT